MTYASLQTPLPTSAANLARPTRYPVTYHTDVKGNEIVEVGIAHNRSFTMDKISYLKLIELGLSMAFWLNDDGNGNEYVRTHYPPASETANNVQVVRLILDVPQKNVVRYKDGDRLNLRLSNLFFMSKAKMRKDLGIVTADFTTQS